MDDKWKGDRNEVKVVGNSVLSRRPDVTVSHLTLPPLEPPSRRKSGQVAIEGASRMPQFVRSAITPLPLAARRRGTYKM